MTAESVRAAMRPAASIIASPDMQGMTFDLLLGAATGGALLRPADGSHPLAAEALHRRASGLAALLASVEPPAGASALIVAQLGHEAIIAALACLRAGLSPFYLPVSATADQIEQALKQTEAPVAIGIDRLADLRPLLSLREAAARSFHLRLLAGFGQSLPDGVAPAEAMPDGDFAPSTAAARPILKFHAAGKPAEAHEADILQLALDLAREIAPAPASRIVTTMSGVDQASLASSFGLALIAGIEVTPLGLFDLAKLWGCLSSSMAIHLVAPAAIEGALADAGLTRHKALASLTLIHEIGRPSRPGDKLAGAGGKIVLDVWRDGAQPRVTRR